MTRLKASTMAIALLLAVCGQATAATAAEDHDPWPGIQKELFGARPIAAETRLVHSKRRSAPRTPRSCP